MMTYLPAPNTKEEDEFYDGIARAVTKTALVPWTKELGGAVTLEIDKRQREFTSMLVAELKQTLDKVKKDLTGMVRREVAAQMTKIIASLTQPRRREIERDKDGNIVAIEEVA